MSRGVVDSEVEPRGGIPPISALRRALRGLASAAAWRARRSTRWSAAALASMLRLWVPADDYVEVSGAVVIEFVDALIVLAPSSWCVRTVREVLTFSVGGDLHLDVSAVGGGWIEPHARRDMGDDPVAAFDGERLPLEAVPRGDEASLQLL